MGLINKSNINAYWNTKDWSQSTPAFGAVFTRDRFLMLHSMLHFPVKQGDTGKLKNVQNLIQHFSEQFRNYYVSKKIVEVQQYNTCIINTITALDSNYFVYVKVKVGIHTIFLFMKASKTQAVNMEFQICIELMAPLLCQGYDLFTKY